jgi:acyl-CoA reductase-like NAD-dependent aldehyde dehydrogenase
MMPFRRVFVQRGLYETFVAKLGPRTEALKMGVEK